MEGRLEAYDVSARGLKGKSHASSRSLWRLGTYETESAQRRLRPAGSEPACGASHSRIELGAPGG